MPRPNRPIIARAPSPPDRTASRLVWGLAAVIGTIAAIHFARLDLTLSHFDARAHVLVARRVTDSLTPGWRQLGGLWLPLPHLLNVVPVMWDWNYRTGASAVVISVLALAAGLAALARYLRRHTGSLGVAIATPLALLVNPNVLFLQSTPMTEPLLLGLGLLSLDAVDDWIRAPDRHATRRAGWCLALLVLTRYEGWLIAAGLLAVAAVASYRRGVRASVALVPYPVAAVAAFALMSRESTGSWLITSGFFVPSNPALGQPGEALRQILAGTRDMASPAVIATSAIGLLVCLARAPRTTLASLLPATLLGAAVLPLMAFEAGHVERVRYMVPLVAACSALAGLAFAVLPASWRGAAAVALLLTAAIQRPPYASDAPMVLEARAETPFREARAPVLQYLAQAYDGTPILASMGSVGPFIQEASAIGLDVKNFLHEGNGDLWTDAMISPRRLVRWLILEDSASGAFGLAARAANDRSFLDGFTRVAGGGGVVLYERR